MKSARHDLTAHGFVAEVAKPELPPGVDPRGVQGVAIHPTADGLILILRHVDGTMLAAELDDSGLDKLGHMMAAVIEAQNAGAFATRTVQ